VETFYFSERQKIQSMSVSWKAPRGSRWTQELLQSFRLKLLDNPLYNIDLGPSILNVNFSFGINVLTVGKIE
jgi:hypothetical protein